MLRAIIIEIWTHFLDIKTESMSFRGHRHTKRKVLGI